MRKNVLIIAAVVAALASCGGKDVSPQPLSEGQGADSLATGEACVDSSHSQTYKEAVVGVTMGKVVAERYADLSFETSLPIERVFVKNGQHVRRGQAIAKLEKQMRRATAMMEYELAAALRDQIIELRGRN